MTDIGRRTALRLWGQRPLADLLAFAVAFGIILFFCFGV